MRAKTLPEPITRKNPGVLWHLDVTYSGSDVVILIYDEHSQQAFIRILPKKDYIPLVLSNFLLFSITNHWKPNTIITDRSIEFKSDLLQRFLIQNRIEHAVYSPYNPQKGKCEWIMYKLRPLFQAAKKEVTLKVDVKNKQVQIKKEDPFREAMLNLHMQIQADIDERSLYNAQSIYASLILCKIENLCRAIDPDLFKKEES